MRLSIIRSSAWDRFKSNHGMEYPQRSWKFFPGLPLFGTATSTRNFPLHAEGDPRTSSKLGFSRKNALWRGGPARTLLQRLFLDARHAPPWLMGPPELRSRIGACQRYLVGVTGSGGLARFKSIYSVCYQCNDDILDAFIGVAIQTPIPGAF
jgi:hypothetical protein